MIGILTGMNNYENVIGSLLMGGDIVEIAIEGVGEYGIGETMEALDYLRRHEMDPKVEFGMTTVGTNGCNQKLYVTFMFRPATNENSAYEERRSK